MGFWDSVTDVVGGIFGGGESSGGGWFKNNKDWLKPVASIGANLISANIGDSGRDAYIDALKQREQNRFNDVKAYNDAYSNYLNSVAPIQDANSAAMSAYNSRMASARRMEDAARMKAARRGLRTEMKGYREAMGLMDPYVKAGAYAAPLAADAYGRGVSMANNLGAMLQAPGAMAKLNQSVPAYSVNIPVPSYLFGAKNK